MPGSPALSPDRPWRRQLQEAVTDPAEAFRLLGWEVPPEADLREASRRFSVRIPRYYLGLIDPADPADPIARQCLPQVQEILDDPGDLEDAVGDRARSPAPGIIQKHPNRVILLAANSCTMYCRFCFRKPVPVGVSLDGLRDGLSAAFDHLRAHPEIDEVILSGGDPLVLDTPVLEALLTRLRVVPHLRVIRIHSRTPVTLPARMDEDLADTLARHRPVWLVTHFNHPRELTPEALAGLDRVARRGIPVLNQSVLLRGVNDDPAVLTALFRGLYHEGILPYYLHHCDRTPGTGSFRLSIHEGRRIYAALRPHLSGPALPRYVLDVPGGHGKVPLDGDHAVEIGPGVWSIHLPNGGTALYREPPAALAGPRSGNTAAAG